MPRKLPHNINEIDDSIPKNKANPNKTNKGALGFHKWSFETKPSDETNYFKWFLFKQTWHEPLLSLELKIYMIYMLKHSFIKLWHNISISTL